MGAWIKAHGSVIFLVVCILGGIGCVYLGQSILRAFPDEQIWSNVLTSLGGSIFAFSLTAFFFSFSDMRKFLDERLTQLFTRPEIIRNFSAEKRAEIRQYVLDAELVKVDHTPLELCEFLHKRQVGYLSSPIAENYNYSASILPGSIAGTVTNHYTLRYRLLTSHLKQSERKVQFRSEFSWKCSAEEEIPLHDWIPEFKLIVGASVFGIGDLDVSSERKGEMIEYRAVFEKEIDIREDTRVSLESKSLGRIEDAIDLCKVKYPTCGVRAELAYEPGLIYDALIFKSDSSSDGLQPDEITLRESSVSVCTDSWLLPGNGFALFFRKPA